MFGYKLFPSHEIQQLRAEFPHHLIFELHNQLGQPIIIATLLRRCCPCPADLVTATSPNALREALAPTR